MIASASNGVKPCVQSQRYESVYVLGVACDSRVNFSRKTPVPQCHVKQYEVVTPTLRGWPVTFSTARKGNWAARMTALCYTVYNSLAINSRCNQRRVYKCGTTFDMTVEPSPGP